MPTVSTPSSRPGMTSASPAELAAADAEAAGEEAAGAEAAPEEPEPQAVRLRAMARESIIAKNFFIFFQPF